MLWAYQCTGTISTNTPTTAGTASWDGNCCQCPACGYGGHGVVYVTMASSSFDYDFKVEKLLKLTEVSWPKPRSTPPPPWRRPIVQRLARYGREMRHRGSFRNFHKMER